MGCVWGRGKEWGCCISGGVGQWVVLEHFRCFFSNRFLLAASVAYKPWDYASKHARTHTQTCARTHSDTHTHTPQHTCSTRAGKHTHINNKGSELEHAKKSFIKYSPYEWPSFELMLSLRKINILGARRAYTIHKEIFQTVVGQIKKTGVGSGTSYCIVLGGVGQKKVLDCYTIPTWEPLGTFFFFLDSHLRCIMLRFIKGVKQITHTYKYLCTHAYRHAINLFMCM